MAVSALLAIAAFSPLALGLPSPAPTSAAHNPRWKRDLQERLARNPRGFTDDDGVAHLPIYRRGGGSSAVQSPKWSRSAAKAKRQGSTIVQTGLGDYIDLTYQVSLEIGGSAAYFQVDTGSSDLWAATSDCTTDVCRDGKSSGAPRYDERQDPNFKSTNLPILFQYGSSQSSTYAEGTLGTTSITFADQQLQNVAFSAVSDTNNSVVRSSAGIFGVGFPIISEAVLEIFNQSLTTNASLASADASVQAEAFLQTTVSAGGAMTRLIAGGTLKSPSYSMTLQRLLDPTNSNAGVLTIGGLPSGVSDSELTYMPVHSYPGEDFIPFPFASAISSVKAVMEVQFDHITINGQVLPNSTIGADVTNSIGTWALIDSGTSLILGPQDLVNDIYALVNYDATTGTVSCDTELRVSIFFGGKEFPINPLDWMQPQSTRDPNCGFLLQAGDPPSSSSVSSWVFGDTFLKNVLANWYIGNADQSDPARIGFLSTTDAQIADSRFESILPSSLSGAFATVPFTEVSVVAPSASLTTSIANPISAGAGMGTGGPFTSEATGVTSGTGRATVRSQTTTTGTSAPSSSSSSSTGGSSSGSTSLRVSGASLLLIALAAAVFVL